MDTDPIIEIASMRDCVGGERIFEVDLPAPVTEALLQRIEGASSVFVLRRLPRPFFRVEVPGRYQVSGILGDSRVRVITRLAVREGARALVLEHARRWIGAEGKAAQ